MRKRSLREYECERSGDEEERKRDGEPEEEFINAAFASIKFPSSAKSCRESHTFFLHENSEDEKDGDNDLENREKLAHTYLLSTCYGPGNVQPS